MSQDIGPEVVEKTCGCGKAIRHYERMCWDCRDNATIEKAEVVTPSTPMCIVGSDTFFWDMEDAQEDHAGRWAHPCDQEPLKINPKRLAERLVESAVEDMTEEAFEDAEDHVNGTDELTAAFEAALVAFNAAQTASSWIPDTKKVFQIPGADPCK